MKPRTRQRVGFVTSVVALLLLRTSLTHAIINGTLDGNLHPNVGVVIFAVDGELISPCSGNLIAPTVFVTAAHCVEFIESHWCDSGVGLVRLARRRGCQFY